MQTVEIVIYMVIALIVGVLTLTLVTTWDYRGIIDKMTGNDDGIKFEKVSNADFALKAGMFWKSCGMGAVGKSASLYLEDDGSGTPMDIDEFFLQVKRINFCNSLQSVSRGCGDIENVVFTGSYNLPHVINLECDIATRELVITG